jgi:hypothetical protein
MSPRLPIAALALLACTGCGDYRLIGQACPDGDCSVDPPPLSECGAQFELDRTQLAPEGDIDRCQLFTLDRLSAVGANGQVYLTRVEVTTMGFANHHLDIRIAPDIDEADGPIHCEELWNRNVRWVPLMASQGEGDVWDLSAAPLLTAKSQRLLINHHAVNMSEDTIDLDVTLDLRCAASPPAVVSHAFEFTDRMPYDVEGNAPFVLATGPCAFSKPVDVLRLYRRTHLITAYTVWRFGQAEPLWASGQDWMHAFEPPERFETGERLLWECEYFHTGDSPIRIGGESSDSCAVLGFYTLPEGGEDPSTERCTL